MHEIDQEPDSWFASAGRVSHEVLQQETTKVANSKLVSALLNAMPDFLLVLNEKRQIVAVNQRLLMTFGVADPESLLGLRPGEALAVPMPRRSGWLRHSKTLCCLWCRACHHGCQNSGLPQQVSVS